MTGRFAPTPSGRMHIGNITAMLAAWLDARGSGSRMLLRIEDIDTPRVLPDADRWIMDDLDWLGLDWDGEPVYQSQRLDLYEEALHALEGIDPQSPLIYPCFCSRADIRAASAPQEGDGFQIYPGTCRRLLRDHPGVVRDRLARGDRHSLRIAMPEQLAVTFDDRVYGPRSYDLAREIGDSVIRRSDGLFAYQFVVTVDDLVTGVDSIVRGRDLLRSTALQTYIRERLVAAGFGATAPSHSVAATSSDSAPADSAPSPTHPAYAHIPLIDNAAGRRLAKRERSLDMGALRARGVTAEQVIGYCAWLLRLTDDSSDESDRRTDRGPDYGPNCESAYGSVHGLVRGPEPCSSADLLPMFRAHGWSRLRANHTDRRLDPDDPTTPRWLADALRA